MAEIRPVIFLHQCFWAQQHKAILILPIVTKIPSNFLFHGIIFNTTFFFIIKANYSLRENEQRSSQSHKPTSPHHNSVLNQCLGVSPLYVNYTLLNARDMLTTTNGARVPAFARFLVKSSILHSFDVLFSTVSLLTALYRAQIKHTNIGNKYSGFLI